MDWIVPMLALVLTGSLFASAVYVTGRLIGARNLDRRDERLRDAPAEDRVRAGIALLDSEGPADWRDRVDWGHLHIMSLCVLHQVYGDYSRGKDALGIPSAGGAAAHGFLPSVEPGDLSELEDAWARLGPREGLR